MQHITALRLQNQLRDNAIAEQRGKDLRNIVSNSVRSQAMALSDAEGAESPIITERSHDVNTLGQNETMIRPEIQKCLLVHILQH